MERQSRKIRSDIEAKADRARLQEEKIELLERAVELALHRHDTPEAAAKAIDLELRENKQYMASLEAEWDLMQGALEEEKANLEKSVDSSKDQFQVQVRNLKDVRQEIKQITLKVHAR
eukprot:TRINITY_DN387_c0_g1_i6.p1 TRINITY_DN387_c0_g1~~TRINITY_DN387_c0_g1_i6.p1  ORF type:complete len:118 (-),score=38.01 TRINITY_DN387_c0_g1_i6:374-727(-)